MAAPSPYRAPPRSDDGARALSFFPQLRLWLIPVVLAVGPAVILLPSTDARLLEKQSSVSCELEFHSQGNWSASSGAPLQKASEQPVTSSCWTCAGKCTNRARRDLMDSGEFREPWQSVDCAAARTELVRFGKADPGTSTLARSPAAGALSHGDAVSRFDACVAANGKTRGALDASTETITVALFESSRSPIATFAALAMLIAFVLCLPTRRVRVTVDRQSRMVRITERGLLRRPIVQELAVDDLLGVILEDDKAMNTQHVVLTRKEGTPIRLFAGDLRPLDLKRRTAKRLGEWLAAARARD